ncbi:hypothetical protein NQ314_013511 [Rhamnusium bicolor]|uniref:Cholesterol side-chain cleavage enzyme, mitochondrial n=1 Tax=Rhamnusium bicolor TaxID=1586634 RepID=A0AAV8X6J8_9CUCU|nr:hypothetical protein NQ314_013511 [Rhamnusium bicolor]
MQEENIDQPDIDRIVADLILGAGDTTTLTMEWVLYLVSKNKEVQQKLRQNDETYLRNVLRETLRLYPVVPFLNRILPNNAIISGYNIPAGTTMFLTIYTSGRDPKYFKNPEQFLPDRWLRDNTHSTVILQKASLPFAVGVRSCVGKKIAETQVMTTLSKIVNKFYVELCNVREIKIDLQMISKPSEELRLKFHKI